MKDLTFYEGKVNVNVIDKIRKQCKEMLKMEFARDDYRELIQLVIFYLGNDSCAHPFKIG